MDDVSKSSGHKFNDIFQELIDLYEIEEHERIYSPELIKFSFLVKRLSSSALEQLRRYFPFPSSQSIYNHTKVQINLYIDSLKKNEIENLHHLTIMHSLHSPFQCPIVLAIYAVCVYSQSYRQFVFIYFIYTVRDVW